MTLAHLFFLVCVNLDLDLFVVLSKWVAHVALKLCHRKEQLVLFPTVGHVSVQKGRCKTSNEAPLVVLYHFSEITLEEFRPKVCQVETGVIIGRKLVWNIYNHFVCIASRHESVSHCFANFKNLIIWWYQLVKLEGRVWVCWQVADLVFAHIHVDALNRAWMKLEIYILTSLLVKLRPESTTATILYLSTWAALASSYAKNSRPS